MPKLLALLVLTALVLPAALACGDDDDSGSNATATKPAATAQGGSGATTAATTSGGDATADYKTKANAAAAKLSKAAETAVKDMMSAQLSQTDPKWEGILNGDADAITAGAAEIKALTPPAAQAEVHKKLVTAADRLAAGAVQLKKSTASGDQGAGTQAFLAFNDGRSQLNDAVTGLK